MKRSVTFALAGAALALAGPAAAPADVCNYKKDELIDLEIVNREVDGVSDDIEPYAPFAVTIKRDSSSSASFHALSEDTHVSEGYRLRE